ncbi:MAG: hypothetical protein KDD81_02570, partial [Rhodobacteraceae bacterium]|nr:hypothetical protein [Paracoccaceae bacterium]MCB2121605.1 hypothetical protein [Paracoccaceae bacterium]
MRNLIALKRLILNTFVYNPKKFPMMDRRAGFRAANGGNHLKTAAFQRWQRGAVMVFFPCPGQAGWGGSLEHRHRRSAETCLRQRSASCVLTARL